MKTGPWKWLKRQLRAPRTIVAELSAIAVCGVLMTLIPQVDVAAGAEWARPETSSLAALATALGLDRIARTFWFLALVVVAAASLGIVLVEQLSRLRREWRQPLTAQAFGRAPFRCEFIRPARDLAALPSASFATTGKLGLAGSPLFHLGLMTVVLAGIARMLFGADAQVDVFEGEVLPPTSAAWAAEWRGPWAQPFALRSPLRLDRVVSQRYPSGALERLQAQISVSERSGEQQAVIAVNQPFDLGAERVYLTALHGPAVLLERRRDGRVEGRAVLLTARGGDRFEGATAFASGVEVRLRAVKEESGALPRGVEARFLRDRALLASVTLEPGQGITLSAGESIRLAELRFWARLSGSRDHSTIPAYVGFALVIAGALLIFSVVRVDTAVLVTAAEGTSERVVVALRAQRFAPLFAERFARLVVAEGGSPPVVR